MLKYIITSIHDCLEIINLRGGTVMGLYSLSMIVLSFYSVIKGKPIDGSVAAMYSTAAVVYGGSRMHSNWLGKKSDATKDDKGGPSSGGVE